MNEVRLAILGAGGVGKSAITIQFLQNHFIEIYDPTIEDCYRKQVAIEDKTYLVEILDTAGQEEYTAMRDQYMRTADGFIVVYDVTNQTSFRELIDFIYRIQMNRPDEKISMVICGNKCDMERQKLVGYQEGKDFANKFKCPFYECSAKLYINIDELWHDVIRQVCRTKYSRYDKFNRKSRSCQLL